MRHRAARQLVCELARHHLGRPGAANWQLLVEGPQGSAGSCQLARQLARELIQAPSSRPAHDANTPAVLASGEIRPVYSPVHHLTTPLLTRQLTTQALKLRPLPTAQTPHHKPPPRSTKTLRDRDILRELSAPSSAPSSAHAPAPAHDTAAALGTGAGTGRGKTQEGSDPGEVGSLDASRLRKMVAIQIQVHSAQTTRRHGMPGVCPSVAHFRQVGRKKMSSSLTALLSRCTAHARLAVGP